MENTFIEYLIGLALIVYPTWRIIKRAGFNQIWAAALLIPGLGWLVILAMLAFSEWPINSERGS